MFYRLLLLLFLTPPLPTVRQAHAFVCISSAPHAACFHDSRVASKSGESTFGHSWLASFTMRVLRQIPKLRHNPYGTYGLCYVFLYKVACNREVLQSSLAVHLVCIYKRMDRWLRLGWAGLDWNGTECNRMLVGRLVGWICICMDV